MINNSIKLILLFVLVFGISIYTYESADAASRVMWGKTELKLGQIGKATTLEDTILVKLQSDGSLSTVRMLKKGEEYRVYSFKSNSGGLYGVGGGSFIQNNKKIKYETPSKSKLALLNGATDFEKVDEKLEKLNLSNDTLMIETGITVANYTLPGDSDLYTVRFRDSQQVGSWLGSIHASQVFMDGYGIIDKDSFWEKIKKIKVFDPIEFFTKHGAMALYEQDNGYDLIDSAVVMPVRSEFKSLPPKIGEELLNLSNLKDEELIFNVVTGNSPKIGMEIGQFLDIDFEKSNEVRDVLHYLLIDNACANYEWKKGIFYCEDEAFARTAIYGNGEQTNMGFIPITNFNPKDIQFSSKHFYPIVGETKPPAFTEENLKLFILDTYKILNNHKPITKNKAYVQEVLESYFAIKGAKVASKDELAKARYKTVIKDVNGIDYNLYLIPKKEKKVLDMEDLSLVSYEGDYGFVLQKKGSSKAIWQKDELKDTKFYEYHYGEEMVYVIEGKDKKAPGVFVLSEHMTINDVFARLYVVSDGKLIKLKFEGDDPTDYSLLNSSKPKFINTDTIQNVEYSNGSAQYLGWKYTNYHIDFHNGLLKQVGQTKSYIDNDFDKGTPIYDRWLKEPNYFVK